MPPVLMVEKPDGLEQSLRQQLDIEDIRPIGFLSRRQQVEKKSPDAPLVQRVGDGLVARTETARAASIVRILSIAISPICPLW